MPLRLRKHTCFSAVTATITGTSFADEVASPTAGLAAPVSTEISNGLASPLSASTSDVGNCEVRGIDDSEVVGVAVQGGGGGSHLSFKCRSVVLEPRHWSKACHGARRG